MTNEEMRTVLAQSGFAVAEIDKIQEKFDADKITEIVEGAANPKEAFESIHAFYPEIEVSKLEEQMNFVQDQLEAAFKAQDKHETVELTENELELVSGGGFFSWIKDNWKKVVVGAAVVVVAAAATAVTLGVAGAACGAVGAVIFGTETLAAGAVSGLCAGAAVGAAAGMLSGTIGAIAATDTLVKEHWS